MRIEAERLVDIVQRLIHLIQTVKTNCNVVSSARRHAVKLDRTLQEFESLRIKLHFQEKRSQIKSKIAFLADRQIGIPHFQDPFVQLPLLQLAHLRQMFFQGGQALAESSVVPATQSQKGENLIQCQGVVNLFERFLQDEEIIRAEFLNRFSVSLTSFDEVVRNIAEHKSGDVEMGGGARRMQHVSAKTPAVLADDLIINHHRERSVDGQGW